MISLVAINYFISKEYPLKYSLLLVGLAFFWAIENFIIQTSAFSIHPLTEHPYFYQGIRLILNLLIATIVLLLFNQFWLIFIIGIDFLLSLIIVAYNQYFHKALSAYYAIKTIKEGLRVAGFAVQIIPPPVWILLIGAMIIKIIWIFNIPPQPCKLRLRGIASCIFLFAIIILSLQFSSFKFANIKIYGIQRNVYTYGYIISWIVENLMAPNVSEISKEIIHLKSLSPDRLTKIEPPWPVGDKIVIIQLESFDFNILHFHISGKEVTPYFNQLARNGRLFKIVSYHSVSTADMDFAVLSGGPPSSRMVSYMVPGISYTNSLPSFLKKYGYYTVSWHGNHGDFFNRRDNFQRMGFDEIYFKEDFKGMGLAHSYWGLRDFEVFRLSSQKICASRSREFHFIITLDSHVPFDLIGDQEKEIFPKSQQWQQNYFNSMHVLDRDVKNYIESLPAETLVILYGDHASGVNYGDFKSARIGETEYVPCIIHICKPTKLPLLPQGLSPAKIVDLTILDIINHLRWQIAR